MGMADQFIIITITLAKRVCSVGVLNGGEAQFEGVGVGTGWKKEREEKIRLQYIQVKCKKHLYSTNDCLHTLLLTAITVAVS